jgi:hypothetical protein
LAEADRLRIGFTLRSLDGLIDVSLTRNTDPGSLGYSLLSGGQPVEFARDFPVCRATVTYPADGYAAVSVFTQKTYVHASDEDLQRGQAALARIHKIA